MRGDAVRDRQCFNDIHQLFELLLSGHITDALDDEVRNEKYPMVAMPVRGEREG